MDSFAPFHFLPALAQAIEDAGYSKPTPVQEQAIPHILERSDVVGIAQTGTGKTAAFVLPILQHLAAQPKPAVRGMPRVLVLAPTRELVAQIEQGFRTYGKYLGLASLALFGGVPQGPQVHALSKGVDIIIATPGRLLDLMRQRFVSVTSVEMFVLDEADRMLEMGFIEDIRTLAKDLPHDRQTLLFSATFSGSIASLAHSYQRKPVRVTVTAEATTVAKTAQSVFFVDKEDKSLLLRRLLAADHVKRAIVFVAMKHVADKLCGKLALDGLKAEALHSDRTQAMRTQIMESFRAGKTRVLIATDIAARGIDVDDVTHVVNYDLPKDAETYVHRIGRTARAGAAGDAWTFCSREEREKLDAIEHLINKKLTVREHKYNSNFAKEGITPKAAPTGPVHSKEGKGKRYSKKRSNHKARVKGKWTQR